MDCVDDSLVGYGVGGPEGVRFEVFQEIYHPVGCVRVVVFPRFEVLRVVENDSVDPRCDALDGFDLILASISSISAALTTPGELESDQADHLQIKIFGWVGDLGNDFLQNRVQRNMGLSEELLMLGEAHRHQQLDKIRWIPIFGVDILWRGCLRIDNRDHRDERDGVEDAVLGDIVPFFQKFPQIQKFPRVEICGIYIADGVGLGEVVVEVLPDVELSGQIVSRLDQNLQILIFEEYAHHPAQDLLELIHDAPVPRLGGIIRGFRQRFDEIDVNFDFPKKEL